MKINVFVSNLAKYNNGELTGKWTTLPVDDINKDILDQLDLGGNSTQGYHDEWFISDYEAPFSISEYDNLYTLNNLAKALADYNNIEEVFDSLDSQSKQNLYLPNYTTESLEDLIQELDIDTVEVARATYFGKIQSYDDDYFFINEEGNFESMNKYQYQEMLKKYATKIIDQFKAENL